MVKTFLRMTLISETHWPTHEDDAHSKSTRKQGWEKYHKGLNFLQEDPNRFPKEGNNAGEDDTATLVTKQFIYNSQGEPHYRIKSSKNVAPAI